MGKPIMIILGIVFGMALLAILYHVFHNPLWDMGDTIVDKSTDILNGVTVDPHTVTPFRIGLNWILR